MAAVPSIFKRKEAAAATAATIVHIPRPYMCKNMALTSVLQALNNYEGSDRFKRVSFPIPRTIEQFRDIFDEITNKSYIFLKAIPAAMHLFVRNGWFADIDCMHDNSLFAIKKTHIYNYIHSAGQWWLIDTQKNICDIIPAMQLGIGSDYCLIPVRRSCAEAFMEKLKGWKPADPFYKTVQAGLIVGIYDQMRVAENDGDLYEQLEDAGNDLATNQL